MGQYDRHVFVCTGGEYCPLDGSVEVHRALKEGIASRGLKQSVRVNKAGCFSQCGNGPMVLVNPEGLPFKTILLTGLALSGYAVGAATGHARRARADLTYLLGLREELRLSQDHIMESATFQSLGS